MCINVVLRMCIEWFQVGEFLGSHQGLGVATMYAYIDQEDFRGLAIDAALRQLLNGFRLPGMPELSMLSIILGRSYAMLVTLYGHETMGSKHETFSTHSRGQTRTVSAMLWIA